MEYLVEVKIRPHIPSKWGAGVVEELADDLEEAPVGQPHETFRRTGRERTMGWGYDSAKAATDALMQVIAICKDILGEPVEDVFGEASWEVTLSTCCS